MYKKLNILNIMYHVSNNIKCTSNSNYSEGTDQSHLMTNMKHLFLDDS